MLDLIANIANAVGTAKPPKVAPGAVGAFWSVPVPGAAAVIPLLLQYAALGYYLAEWNQRQSKAKLISVSALPSRVDCSSELDVGMQEPVLLSAAIPYPFENVRRLCTGQPAQFGKLELQMTGNLLPSLRIVDDKTLPCVIRWDQPIQAAMAPAGWFRRLARWVTHFEIQGLRIGPHGGELITNSVKGLLLPSLTW